MQIIRSVIAQDESIVASAVKTYDLPTNPLSHILFTLKGLNVTDEATLAEVLARASKIEVLYQGQSIYSLSGADLFALNSLLFGASPILTNRVATDNATRAITLILPMGRRLYDPSECFPATQKGQLQLQITLSATETAIDGIIYQIETVEMLDVTPKRHLKVTTLAKTPSATGEQDVSLPIGNVLAGVLMYGTTVPTTTAWTATIDYAKLMLDNKELNYAKANWETLHNEVALRVSTALGYAAAAGADDLSNYALIDLSPRNIDDMLVDTKGLSSIAIKINAGDTNALRLLPIELVAV